MKSIITIRIRRTQIKLLEKVLKYLIIGFLALIAFAVISVLVLLFMAVIWIWFGEGIGVLSLVAIVGFFAVLILLWCGVIEIELV